MLNRHEAGTQNVPAANAAGLHQIKALDSYQSLKKSEDSGRGLASD